MRPVNTWLPLSSSEVVTAVVPPVPVSVPPLQVMLAVVRVPVPLKLPPDKVKASAVVFLAPKSSEPEEIVRVPPQLVAQAHRGDPRRPPGRHGHPGEHRRMDDDPVGPPPGEVAERGRRRLPGRSASARRGGAKSDGSLNCRTIAQISRSRSTPSRRNREAHIRRLGQPGHSRASRREAIRPRVDFPVRASESLWSSPAPTRQR